MHITDILAESRIYVDRTGEAVRNKHEALKVLAEMLAPALDTDRQRVENLLVERENLQSTGIGDGVAIPHASLEAAPRRSAALLLCPKGVPFDAVDGENVCIIIGVVGPKEATSEHLRVLARISRLLRDEGTRRALAASETAEDAFALIQRRDQVLG
jgi:PTS system nitrogen regulatory IIA component